MTSEMTNETTGDMTGDPTTVTYPSADFPAPPPVSIDVPPAWETVSIPGVAIAARATASEADFASNVVVRVGTRRAQDQPADILMEVTGSMAGRPGSTVSPIQNVEVDGVSWTRIQVSWQDPNGIAINQTHLSASLPRDEQVQDFIHLTGSTGGAAIESDDPLVQGVLASVRIRR